MPTPEAIRPLPVRLSDLFPRSPSSGPTPVDVSTDCAGRGAPDAKISRRHRESPGPNPRTPGQAGSWSGVGVIIRHRLTSARAVLL